jgi:hypothetical protein
MTLTRLKLCLLILFFCSTLTQAQSYYSNLPSRRNFQNWNYMADYNKARAAGHGVNYYLRSEIAIGYVSCPITLTQRNYGIAYEFDTTMSRSLKATFPIQVCATSGYPLRNMSDNAALIFTYGVNAHITVFEEGGVKMLNTTYGAKFTNFDLGVPLSIDYKSGAEANLDPNKSSCFTLGVGLEPVWLDGFIANISYSKISLKPFIKAEYGMLLGSIVLKLRGTMFLGKYTYFDRFEEDSDQASEVRIAGQNPMVLSLVINTMAGHWGD